MELKVFISDVLRQMEELRNIPQKSSYLVEELEFELGITVTDNTAVGVKVFVLNAGGGTENQNIQKVKIKLIPKNSRKKISMIV